MSTTGASRPGRTTDPADPSRLSSADSFAQRLAELDEVIAVLDAERGSTQDKTLRDEEMTQPWSLFMRRMRLHTPQAYGTRIQNYMTHFYGWSTVPASANRGDAVVTDGSHVEIKVTVMTASNGKANIRQIRPYQDISGYRVFVVDSDYHVWRFDLSKSQMDEELKLVGTNSHMVADTASENQHRELSIEFPWDVNNVTCSRWLRDYLVTGSARVTPDMMPDDSYESASQVAVRYQPHLLEIGVEETLMTGTGSDFSS